MNRIVSIIFYLFVAAVTCAMAYQIQPYQAGEPVWICGQRTRKSVQNRLLITGIFCILFLIMALRFDIGNDYGQYTETAHEAFVGGYVVTEVGFNWLVRFLYGLAGGEYYELLFAVFAFATLLFFLKAFARQSADFSQTFFLFMTLGVYFQTFNTVRYYFALSIAFFSMKYVLENDYLKFVFWILIAALFHKSVLLVLPVYWMATFAWKRWQIVAGLAASAACYVGKSLVLKLALVLYPSYRNTVFLEGGVSWFSVLRALAVLAFYLWFLYVHASAKEADSGSFSSDVWKAQGWYRELRFYGQLNLLALVTGTFFSFLPVVTRISYYFGVSQLLMIPLILCNIREQKVRRKATAIVFVVCILYFITFLLYAHQDGVRLLPYQSWLFEPMRYVY
ncbi:MAG: EpsG family protein [Lachnospiraceae bacterium]|nr:EpsG family protein [Lachnospiraceae bacterium]